MVRIGFLLMIVMFWPSLAFPVQAGNGIALSLKADEVEFGKPLQLIFKSGYSRPGLDTIDLSPLEKDFVVETPWDVQEDSHGARQYWHIRLYARRPGSITLPSLAFHGKHTQEIPVRITPAIDHTDHVPIHVQAEVGNTGVWLNQGVPISVTIENSSPHVQLESDAPQQPGVTIEQLPVVRQTQQVDGVGRVRHRLTWILYPQVPGKLQMQLPAIRYRRDGVTTHRFYPPAIRLDVRPLPSFVPPTLPVGRREVDLLSSLPPVLLKNRLNFLTLQLKMPGAGRAGVSQVLRQLRSNGRIVFHSPQLLEQDHGLKIYRIPYESKGMGLVTLPTLRLQYFDPASGKLLPRKQPLGRVVSISPWMAYAVLILFLAALFLVSGKIYRWFKRRYHRYRHYRKALQSFRLADGPAGFREGIAEIARAEHWPHNLTLNAWLERWSARYPQAASLASGVAKLQQNVYAGTETSPDEMRPLFTAVCYRQEPWLLATERETRANRIRY